MNEWASHEMAKWVSIWILVFDSLSHSLSVPNNHHRKDNAIWIRTIRLGRRKYADKCIYYAHVLLPECALARTRTPLNECETRCVCVVLHTQFHIFNGFFCEQASKQANQSESDFR